MKYMFGNMGIINLVPRSQSVRGCRNVTVGVLGTRLGNSNLVGKVLTRERIKSD